MKWISGLLALEPVNKIPHDTARALMLYPALLVAFIIVERLLGKNIARYRNRSVLYDFIYCIFFNGGYFTLAVWPILKLTERALAPYRLDVLPHMSLPVATIVFYVIVDFSFYWAHRLLHTKYLWPFHAVHHSQTELTVLTTARFHIVDVAVLTIVTAIPAIILGFPGSVAAVSWCLMLQDKVQHADLDWTYGPLYSIVVSPRFHRIHHAADAGAHNQNYGRMFTVWDQLFGTAAASREEPERFGVNGLVMRESFITHFTMPFRTIFDLARASVRDRAGDSAPRPTSVA